MCNKYNFMELPHSYFGEYKFYDYFMNKSSKFQGWLQLAKKDPKKHVRQPLKNNPESIESEPEDEEEGAETQKNEAGKEERMLSEFEQFKIKKLRRKEKAHKRKIKIAMEKSRRVRQRILSSLDQEVQEFKVKEKIDEIADKVKGYKQIVKKMKNQNMKFLKNVYKQSKKLIQSTKKKNKLRKKRSKKRMSNQIGGKGKDNNYINRRQVRESLSKEKLFFKDKRIKSRLDRGIQKKTSKKKNRKNKKSKQGKPWMGRKKHIGGFKAETYPSKHMKKGGYYRKLKTDPQTQTETETEKEDSNDAEDSKEPAKGQVVGPSEKEKENLNCNSCDKTIASQNSTDIYKSEFIMRSKEIKYSKYLNDSMVCNNCKFSNKINNSTNISYSNNTINSTNVTFSDLVTNCTNVINGTNITNSTLVKFSQDIKNSTVVEVSDECVNCTNCKNCTMCRNVTNCTNCFNITHSANVSNATHGSKLFNVTDVYNVRNLTNATNMTSATNCVGCENNYNCNGEKCNIPRIPSHIQQVLDKKIFENTERIVKRLYDLTLIGDVSNYRKHQQLFDRHIFRANNYLFDLARYRVIFDVDGIDFDYYVSNAFDIDSSEVFKKAVEHLSKSKSDFMDSGIKDGLIVQEEGFVPTIVDIINSNSDFMSVHDFMRDADKGVISYASLMQKDDLELEAYDHYVKKLSREEDEQIYCDPRKPDYSECQIKKKEIERVQKEEQEEQEKLKKEAEGQEPGDKQPEEPKTEGSE